MNLKRSDKHTFTTPVNFTVTQCALAAPINGSGFSLSYIYILIINRGR